MELHVGDSLFLMSPGEGNLGKVEVQSVDVAGNVIATLSLKVQEQASPCMDALKELAESTECLAFAAMQAQEDLLKAAGLQLVTPDGQGVLSLGRDFSGLVMPEGLTRLSFKLKNAS
ncbi:hypothetical protein NVS55_18160 [Myxococcus stipitatus]|uniref:hypothetical protein n=1 Tax=Myxococcus stipitatus TaxID=83455 RepID=UPI003144DC65